MAFPHCLCCDIILCVSFLVIHLQNNSSSSLLATAELLGLPARYITFVHLFLFWAGALGGR